MRAEFACEAPLDLPLDKSFIWTELYLLRAEYNAMNGGPQSFTRPTSVGDMEELFYRENKRDITIEIKLLNTEEKGPHRVPHRFVVALPRPNNLFTLEAFIPDTTSYKGLNLALRDNLLVADNSPIADFGPLFDLCLDLTSALYIGPFRNAINVGTMPSYFDISVGQAFIQAWKEFKSGSSRKMNESIFRLTDDIRRIFDFRQREINPSPTDQTLQFFVNGRSFALGELGAGLTQFVLVLANAATKQPAFILIDEPELNLHPSLQLDFLTTLGSYAKRGVLFATHSYGLARARAQTVYTLRPDPDEGSEVRPLESTPRLSELLGELSFSAYRELGFEKVLLVEGVTEVLAVQQFLRTYNKDHKVVPLPMGGAALINGSREAELEEIKRITPNIHALIDSERIAAGAHLSRERMDFVDICGKLGIDCHVLERRATENYLTEAAVKTIMGDKYRALRPYESLKDVNPGWSKNDNWRIARMMKKGDLSGTDLGPFLEKL